VAKFVYSIWRCSYRSLSNSLDQKIQYAKSKSDVIARLDGTYNIPTSAAAKAAAANTPFVPLPGQAPPAASSTTMPAVDSSTQGVKRPREEESG